jgi:hypothetical protein
MKSRKFSTITFILAAYRQGSGDCLIANSLQYGRVDVLVERRKMDDDLKKEVMRQIKTAVDKLQRKLS